MWMNLITQKYDADDNANGIRNVHRKMSEILNDYKLKFYINMKLEMLHACMRWEK